MEKYKVLNEAGIAPVGSETVVLAGEVAELDPENEQTVRFLEAGLIVPVLETEIPTIVPDEATVPANPITEAAAEAAEAPLAAESLEPRKRYRGKLVISENQRTVENQTFTEISLEDGSKMDLTDKEYATEVHVTYPPTA